MKKTYCLDTNVLIHDPSAVFAFEDNCVVVTEYVLFELDDLKKKHTDPAVKQSAMDAAKFLLEISNGLSAKVVAQQKKEKQEGKPIDTKSHAMPELPIPGTEGKLIILMDDPGNRIKWETRDDQILGLLHKHRDEFPTPIVVVSKDVLMSIKAIARGFGYQDYRRDQARVQLQQLPVLDAKLLPIDALFAAPGTPVPAEGILSATYKDGDQDMPVIAGYYVIKYDEGKETLVSIDSGGSARVILQTPNLCRTNSFRGIRAKNLEQHAAVDALLSDQKTLVCLMGPAGTGKTLLAVASALDVVRKTNRGQQQPPTPAESNGEGKGEGLSRREKKTLHNQQQQQNRNGSQEKMRILIARPMVSMGEEMGFLPGDISEKMRPWIQPIIDNLKLLLGQKQVDDLLSDGTIELQPLQFIRGRSISNAYLIIDESQNTSPLEIKTIITRAGSNCRVVLTGDPAQIDRPYLSRLSNGLTYAADRMGKEDFTAVVPLTKCERSVMASRAAELL
jgi:PhoH-like ATPase